MNDNIKSILVLCGIASVIGALTGLGLRFTALSPLVIGGIVAAVPVILLAAFITLNDAIKEKFNKEDFSFLVSALQVLQLELVLLQVQLLFFLA